MIEALLSNDGLLLHKTLIPQCLSFPPDIIDPKDTDNGAFIEVLYAYNFSKLFFFSVIKCFLFIQSVWKDISCENFFMPLYDTDLEGLTNAKLTPPNSTSESPKELSNAEESKESAETLSQSERSINSVEAQALIQMALKGTLNVPLQQKLLACLEQDEDVVYQVGITPKQVMQI